MSKKKKKVKEPEPKAMKDFLCDLDQKFMQIVSKNTTKILNELWIKNFEENYKNGLWNIKNALNHDCLGIAKNKCVIGIGAGQCFNKNKDVLKEALNRDGVKNWENRSFITIASNHQFKPLLKMGIIPDFVMLVDASDVVYDQLCVDIPMMGQNTVLITGLHCSPKVLKAWTEQGRTIRYFLNMSKEVRAKFKDITGIDDTSHAIELGGNVLNGAWIVGLTKMGSTVFMCVGNDLSYADHPDLQKRKKEYYADGDYSTNDVTTGTGRDEATKMKKWAGYNLSRRLIVSPDPKDTLRRYNIELDLVGTTHTLWVYKIWLEAALMSQVQYTNNHFHYFNCTEGGILGVMSKEKTAVSFTDPTNWYMLDEVCRFYHTAMLGDAILQFEKSKELFECKERDARNAGVLVVPNYGDIVKSATLTR
jgi:hypothetical protein